MANPNGLFEDLQEKEQQLNAIRDIVLAARESSLPESTQAQPEGGQSYWKAMTLKLDRERFVTLKQLGLEQNKTSQTLLIEAVDLLIGNRT